MQCVKRHLHCLLIKPPHFYHTWVYVYGAPDHQEIFASRSWVFINNGERKCRGEVSKKTHRGWQQKRSPAMFSSPYPSLYVPRYYRYTYKGFGDPSQASQGVKICLIC